MTAVKKLLNYVTPYLTDKILHFLSLVFIEAMKQEEQQIKDAYNQGFREGVADSASYPNISDSNDVSVYENAQNYYNETFKK